MCNRKLVLYEPKTITRRFEKATNETIKMMARAFMSVTSDEELS